MLSSVILGSLLILGSLKVHKRPLLFISSMSSTEKQTDILRSRILPDKYWFHPPLDKLTRLWNIRSHLLCILISALSKGWLEKLNRTVVYNKEKFESVLDNRNSDQGLITVSNHHSCMDEPLLWGMSNWRHTFAFKTRWTPTAQEICFTNIFTAKFFTYGRCIPIIRGDGVFQRGMDYCIDVLNTGQWVHIFPEGKVNMEPKENIRLKWGVGRLVADSIIPPIVLPIYHLGMDSILPNGSYFPRIWKNVTIVIGEPLDYTEDLTQLRSENKSPMEIRKYITDKIQAELRQLKIKAERLHFKEKDKDT